jgi:hypothetical protein
MHSAAIFKFAAIVFLAHKVNAVAVAFDNGAEISSYGWATFYDDNACTSNPGEAVSMGNSGCLANEYNRNSIYIQPGLFSPSLVWSPGNTCNCQNHCTGVSVNGGNNYCWNLNGNPGAQSFRFIQQGCSGDNC